MTSASLSLRGPARRRSWWLAFAAHAAVCVTAMALATRGALPFAVRTPYDAVVHFVMLGAAAFLLHQALGRRATVMRLPLGLMVIAVLATAEEVSQAWIPTRTFSLLDLGANLGGVATAAALDAWLAARDG